MGDAMTWRDEIRARLKAATPGPWEHVEPNADEGDIRVQAYHHHKRTVIHDCDAVAWKLKPEDAAFISQCPTDINRLLEALSVAMEALEYYAPSPDWYGDKAKEARERIEKLGEENA